MARPYLDGKLSKTQHEFLKGMANRIHEREIRIALLDTKGKEQEKRELMIEQASETRKMAYYLDLLTETEGYKALQGIIDQQKLLGRGK